MSKKLVVFNLLTLIFCLLFALFQIPLNMDISIVALPLSLGFTIALALLLQKVLLQKNLKFIFAASKVMEYVPCVFLVAFIFKRAGEFGTPFWYDVVTVLLWIFSTVCSIFASHYLSPKRIFDQNKDFKPLKAKYNEKKLFGIKKILFDTADWIDALVQAVFAVTLFNIFVLQLYEIPSESMVPELYIKDKLAVIKTATGPKFPLSNVGIPTLKKYERGDIVVFRNPHYSNDRKSEVKTFVSQLVYMLSFTTIKTNVDSNGDLKADPLVKRITGLPGEQLMMQDGVLYHRTSENPNFVPVTDDAKWAEWNLAGLSAKTKKNISVIPVSKANYSTMLKVEEKRNELDIESVKNECFELAANFTNIRNYLNELGILAKDEAIPVLISKKDLTTRNLTENEFTLTQRLLATKGGAEWFTAFMTDWSKATPNDNLYDESMYKLNAMIKLQLGRIFVRNAELSMNGNTQTIRNADQTRMACLEELNELYLYTQLMNGRNMPIFPANKENGEPQYIPENCFFLMGDNRFNSLDLRHSYDEKLVSLTKTDAYSIQYISYVEPQYLEESRILGTPVLRFMPASRFGVPGLTGEKSK